MLLQASIKKALNLIISKPVDASTLNVRKGPVILANILVKLLEVEVRLFNRCELIDVILIP
jgi:hypothetical protein